MLRLKIIFLLFEKKIIIYRPYWAIGLLAYWPIGLLSYWPIELLGYWPIELLAYWAELSKRI